MFSRLERWLHRRLGRSEEEIDEVQADRRSGSKWSILGVAVVVLGAYWFWPVSVPSCSDSLDTVEGLVRQTLRDNSELRMSFPAPVLSEFVGQPYGFEAVRELSEGDGSRTCTAQVLVRKISQARDGLLPNMEPFEEVEWEVYLTEDDEVYVQIL